MTRADVRAAARPSRSGSSVRPPAGDGLHLVERAAGVAEAPARELRHRGAARRDERAQGQRDLVADAARRVLVDRGPRRRPTGRAARPLSIMAAVQVASSRWSSPRNTMAISSAGGLLVGDRRRRCSASRNQRICSSVSARPSRLVRMTSTAASISSDGQMARRRRRRAAASPIGCGVPSPSTRQVGPAVPPTAAGGSGRTASTGCAVARPSRHATSRPPPPACRAETSPHSAHSVSPYEAFSTLQPVTTRPSSTSAAAPTREVRVRRVGVLGGGRRRRPAARPSRSSRRIARPCATAGPRRRAGAAAARRRRARAASRGRA